MSAGRDGSRRSPLAGLPTGAMTVAIHTACAVAMIASPIPGTYTPAVIRPLTGSRRSTVVRERLVWWSAQMAPVPAARSCWNPPSSSRPVESVRIRPVRSSIRSTDVVSGSQTAPAPVATSPSGARTDTVESPDRIDVQQPALGRYPATARVGGACGRRLGSSRCGRGARRGRSARSRWSRRRRSVPTHRRRLWRRRRRRCRRAARRSAFVVIAGRSG